jgi:RNA polymerase sigma-70 factor (ECF subfamily)
MTETFEPHRGEAGRDRQGAGMTKPELAEWFIREVFPLEAALMQYLHRNWRNESDLADLRQDIYISLYEAAKVSRPDPVRPFLFKVARNLLINRVRRSQVVPIDAVADMDALDMASSAPGQDRAVIAREELRALQSALDRLSPRYREAVVLARIEGLSGREIASRMNISESAVSHYLDRGIRALAEMLYALPPDPRKNP